jgi:hypothetical protein
VGLAVEEDLPVAASRLRNKIQWLNKLYFEICNEENFLKNILKNSCSFLFLYTYCYNFVKNILITKIMKRYINCFL